MKKRLICLALGLALCLGAGSALATEEDLFPTEKIYPGYADVAETDWFYDNARLCYEIGLMNGTDKGFEPGKVLTVAECAAMAARLREKLTGEVIPEVDPTWYVVSPPPWWAKYTEYMSAAGPMLTGLLAHPEEECSRYSYLSLLNAAIPDSADILSPINTITLLPDTDSDTVLKFYNAGILTGVDKLGTFAGGRTLTRSEAAAMVSRIARPALRQSFVPGDPLQSPDYRMKLALEAAYLPSGAVVLVGVTSEQFLAAVNESIARWEAALGDDFNWQADGGDGKTVLAHVKEETLSALGVAAQQGGELYRDFDYQVYYSRLIDITGKTLEPDYAVGVGA